MQTSPLQSPPPMQFTAVDLMQSAPIGADGMPMELMSCDALLAYLEQRLGQLSGRIKDKMNLSNKNADAIADMNRLSQELGGLQNGTTSADKVLGSMQELIASHGADGTLTASQVSDLNAACAQLQNGGSLGPAQLDSLVALNNNQADALGKLDSLNLIDLQSLVSQMSQATSMVSSMMASINETARGVIANMR
jgi:hypothetical protein